MLLELKVPWSPPDLTSGLTPGHPWSSRPWVWRAPSTMSLNLVTWKRLLIAVGDSRWGRSPVGIRGWCPGSQHVFCYWLLHSWAPHLSKPCGPRLPQGTHETGGESNGREKSPVSVGTWSCQLCCFSLLRVVPHMDAICFSNDHCWTSFQVLGCHLVFTLVRYQFKSFTHF